MTPAERARGLRRERVRASKLNVDGMFRNPSGAGPGIKGNPLPLFGDFLFGRPGRRPPGVVPVESPQPVWSRPVETGLRVTWLGHSTVLLELDGRRVLTDPVFGERVSPVSFAGPRRFHATPCTLDELPPLDAVLVSHDHFDHLCATSVATLARRGVPFVTPLGVGEWLVRYGVPAEQVTELEWGESADVGGVQFVATPCQHVSGRGLLSRNKTLWASWVMRGSRHSVFFSGDTGLTTDFQATGRDYGPFDLVMLEVGAFHEAWGSIHLGPKNALTAFDWLGGGTLMPVHWGTFDLALHGWDDPVEQLVQLAAAGGQRVLTPPLGRPFEVSQVSRFEPWWRAVRGLGV